MDSSAVLISSEGINHLWVCNSGSVTEFIITADQHN